MTTRITAVEIIPGAQYDREGVTLRSYEETDGVQDRDLWTSIDRDGKILAGFGIDYINNERVREAVAATLADRQARTIELSRREEQDPEDTTDERKARSYDNLQNEGGEGYNPYRHN